MGGLNLEVGAIPNDVIDQSATYTVRNIFKHIHSIHTYSRYIKNSNHIISFNSLKSTIYNTVMDMKS